MFSPDIRLLGVVAAISIRTAGFAQEAPVTLMTLPGKLLASEDFSKPLLPPEGNTTRFASGFTGWRFNMSTKAGHWEIENGAFKGVELPEANHPAAASLGVEYKNAVITCEVRMNDVPFEGRKNFRGFWIRTTDKDDYICTLMVHQGGMRIQKDDHKREGPHMEIRLGQLNTPVKLNEWQKVTFEILNEEMVGTLNGRSLTGTHPLIDSDKKSVMFVTMPEGSVRNIRVWEALPNPNWAKNKEKILAEMAPGVPAAPSAPTAK